MARAPFAGRAFAEASPRAHRNARPEGIPGDLRPVKPPAGSLPGDLRRVNLHGKPKKTGGRRGRPKEKREKRDSEA